jgi:hypothetical protein
MSRFSIITGLILIVLAAVSYILSAGESWTALIPAIFGIPMVVLGCVAKKESARRHAMHTAVAIAMVGFFGTIRVLPKFLTMIGGNSVERPGAVVAQIIMSIICITFVGAGIKSFVDARRNKTA